MTTEFVQGRGVANARQGGRAFLLAPDGHSMQTRLRIIQSVLRAASGRLANTRDVVLRPQELRNSSRQLINYAAKDTLENTLSGCTPPATLRRLHMASVPGCLQLLPEGAHSR